MALPLHMPLYTAANAPAHGPAAAAAPASASAAVAAPAPAYTATSAVASAAEEKRRDENDR